MKLKNEKELDLIHINLLMLTAPEQPDNIDEIFFCKSIVGKIFERIDDQDTTNNTTLNIL